MTDTPMNPKDYAYLSFEWHLASLLQYAIVSFPMRGGVDVTAASISRHYPDIQAAYWHTMGKLGILPHKPRERVFSGGDYQLP